ncbi:MAG: DUF1553 domain-containing protein [Bacteroidota bacterium]
MALLIIGCSDGKPDYIRAFDDALPEVIDYNFHVRPILSDNCFACHGPDAENQKAGLRLDVYEGATSESKNGHGRAIVPGRLSSSEAFHRMITNDLTRIMPPPESHLKLSDKEIAIIAKWIEQGAAYKPHWAFEKPVKKKLPDTKNQQWATQPIDRFILNRLEREGLAPSEKATKESLIRRVTFDLTGLPPSLKKIDDFVSDDASDAYEKLVDKLLTSPAYGERMAADWMDVARFADSDGYLDDKHRDFSPWRNWVIDAYNRNMPYDQFITWQLAGDLLPHATKESTLATAFNRLHKKNSEAGIVFEEYRVEYVADRTNTLGTGIMGLSLECARCHDHKYDPISQKNYFELFAFFNSTFEIGTPVYGPGQVPGPSLLLSDEEQDFNIDELRAMIARQEQVLAETKNADTHFNDWVASASADQIDGKIDQSMTAYYPLDKWTPTEKDQSFTTPNVKNATTPATLRNPVKQPGVSGSAFFVSDYNSVRLGNKVGWFDRSDDLSLQLSVKPDRVYEDAGILWHSEGIRVGLKGYSLYLKENKVTFIMARSWPQNAIQVTTEEAIPVKKWSQLTVTYDGSSRAEGIAIYVDGVKQSTTTTFDNLYKSILFERNIHTYGFAGITLGARSKFIPFKDGGIDDIKVFDRQLSELEVHHLFDPSSTKALLMKADKNETLLKEHYLAVVSPEVLVAKSKLKEARDKENEFISDIAEIMVMGDLPEPRDTYVLDRGVYSNPTDKVVPNTPKSILEFDERFPKNRLGLAQWLFDEENPLTSRVYVNRMWQLFFGTGLVKTAEDFGAQGSLPTHPDLLDWLAVDFIENGWDTKYLQKMIVMSAAYRQSSKVTPDLLETDPENLLLTHGPRYRMPAEMIRDNALAVSGLLVTQQGGESVYPYQPEGLWDGLTTKKWAYKYLLAKDEGLYRRSLYTIWKRQAPPPTMQLFDVGDRGVCTVRRRLSSTPLQALALQNDPQFVEASRVMAERLIRTEPDTTRRLNTAFRMLTGRAPNKKEQQILHTFYLEEHENFTTNKSKALAFLSTGEKEWDQKMNPSEIAALGVVISGIMNTSESFTKK